LLLLELGLLGVLSVLLLLCLCLSEFRLVSRPTLSRACWRWGYVYGCSIIAQT
jgi:hypothetical protein